MSLQPTEDLLKLVWTRQLYTNHEPVTCDGRPLRVLSHGSINPEEGVDITDAEIEIDGTVYKGPVAVHERASSWREHLHHTDMAYDECILHIVSENDTAVCRVDGSVIPALTLDVPEPLRDTFRQLTQRGGIGLCGRELRQLSAAARYNILTRLTIERLENKYDEFLQYYTLAGNDWNEAFYIRLFRSMGAGSNQEPYIKLARTVRYRDLCRIRESIPSVEALLLGSAGLLDTERRGRFPDDYTIRLQREFDHLARRFDITPMRESEWERVQMRSPQIPVMRLVELAGLLATKDFLFSKLIESGTIAEIRRILDTQASEYWDTHSQVNVPSRENKPKRFGTLMLDILTINLVIPMKFTYGKIHSDDALQEQAVELLEKIGAESNRYTVPWEKQGIRPDNAFFSQALIQLSKEYCEKKRCAVCNIGKRLLCSPEAL